MDEAQLILLRDAIAADPLLSLVPQDSTGAERIVDAYNVPAIPEYWVRRTFVTKTELLHGTSPDGTTFTWVGNGFIGRSAGEHVTWQEMFDTNGYINPAPQNVQQAFDDIFSGVGNAAANRTHIKAMIRRLASRFERLYTTGTGTAATPGLLGVEGPLTVETVIQAWGI